MKWELEITRLCGLLIAVGIAETAENQNAAVRVRLWDYAHVSPRTLATAKAETSAILLRAGVRLEWADCRLHEAEAPKDTSCESPITHLDLQVRILDGTMAKRVDHTRDSLGFALLADGFDSFAAVFLHRAIDLEGGHLATRSAILAAMLAHEIGHLLMDQADHSKAGLMRASWTNDDLKTIAQGRMDFTKEQRQLIVSMISRRRAGERSATTK